MKRARVAFSDDQASRRPRLDSANAPGASETQSAAAVAPVAALSNMSFGDLPIEARARVAHFLRMATLDNPAERDNAYREAPSLRNEEYRIVRSRRMRLRTLRTIALRLTALRDKDGRNEDTHEARENLLEALRKSVAVLLLPNADRAASLRRVRVYIDNWSTSGSLDFLSEMLSSSHEDMVKERLSLSDFDRQLFHSAQRGRLMRFNEHLESLVGIAHPHQFHPDVRNELIDRVHTLLRGPDGKTLHTRCAVRRQVKEWLKNDQLRVLPYAMPSEYLFTHGRVTLPDLHTFVRVLKSDIRKIPRPTRGLFFSTDFDGDDTEDDEFVGEMINDDELVDDAPERLDNLRNFLILHTSLARGIVASGDPIRQGHFRQGLDALQQSVFPTIFDSYLSLDHAVTLLTDPTVAPYNRHLVTWMSERIEHILDNSQFPLQWLKLTRLSPDTFGELVRHRTTLQRLSDGGAFSFEATSPLGNLIESPLFNRLLFDPTINDERGRAFLHFAAAFSDPSVALPDQARLAQRLTLQNKEP